MDTTFDRVLQQESLMESNQKGSTDSNCGKDGSFIATVIPESILDDTELILDLDKQNLVNDSHTLMNKNQWEIREDINELEDSSNASVLSDYD